MLRDDYNPERPLIMHIDLNSCFATVEQQARPTLRGRPVAIVNRRTEHTAIVTASYEAKACGVSVGMKLREAKRLCPGIIALESDPPKYRFVYRKLLAIMNRYSAHVRMKSIDEGVIDFHRTTEAVKQRSLEGVGLEIKQRLRDEVGRAMRCNVGIGPNRFLAKTAASLHKPDGLDMISADNLRAVYGTLALTDLTGIAERSAAKLQAVGIETPLEFLDADPITLRKVVFKSVVGEQWHQRLRGWEVDDIDHPLRTAGRQYVLERRDMSTEEVLARLHHLCEAVGRKVRSQGLAARGVSVYIRGQSGRYWQERRMSEVPFSSDGAIYAVARQLFVRAPEPPREIGVSCYQLQVNDDTQLSLFGDSLAQTSNLTSALDELNDRYGERTIHSAHTLQTGEFMAQKIPFGSTRYL